MNASARPAIFQRQAYEVCDGILQLLRAALREPGLASAALFQREAGLEEQARCKLPFELISIAALSHTDLAPPWYAWEGLIPSGMTNLSGHGGAGKPSCLCSSQYRWCWDYRYFANQHDRAMSFLPTPDLLDLMRSNPARAAGDSYSRGDYCEPRRCRSCASSHTLRVSHRSVETVL